jgi:hypothetical protein
MSDNNNTSSDRYRIIRPSTDEDEYIKCFICGKKIKKYGWKYDFEQPYYLHIKGDFATESEHHTICYYCHNKKGKSHYDGYVTSERYLGLRHD